MNADGTIDWDKLAEMFLTKYKEYVVDYFRGNNNRKGKESRSVDERRFRMLLSAHDIVRDVVRTSQRLCHIYDNPEWHSIVLDTLYLDTIYANVDKVREGREDGKKDSQGDEYTDDLVRELLRYFKHDFFRWCNQPECSQCHSDSQQESLGVTQPNSEEARYECGAVELYKCGQCGTVTRFPRYNDPIKLLQTRVGRCGEWCNVFTLVLKSFGLDVRYVVNLEDHVWCEYYSPFLKRWAHVDSCEESFDEPFIYSRNWNKSMSYCIAYGSDGVVDVSDKYILKENALPRDKIKDDDLRFVCGMITRSLRHAMSPEEIYRLHCMDEQDYFHDNEPGEEEKNKKNKTIGRQSGSTAWTTARGEDGS